MLRKLLLIFTVFFASFVIINADAFLGGDLPAQNIFSDKVSLQNSGIIDIYSSNLDKQVATKRYLIFGNGDVPSIATSEILYTIKSQNGFFSVGVLQETDAFNLRTKGYAVIEDFLLDFHASDAQSVPEISQISKIVGSDIVHQTYNYTGKGIKIAIVDTGVDFSNPDIQHSLARDENNIPVMLDADGQGIILTNATFIANIDKYGILRNYTKQLPQNITSSVYIKHRDGVYLDISQNGKAQQYLFTTRFFH